MEPSSKRPRLAPAEQIDGGDGDASNSSEYSVGQRVVYSPAEGGPHLATVRCVISIDGKQFIGIETDQEVPALHDGIHPSTEKYYFRCQPGHGCYVLAGSGNLIASPLFRSESDAQEKLLHGLESKSESDALRVSQRQRLAEVSMRSQGWAQNTYRQCWDVNTQKYVYLEAGRSDAIPRPLLPRSSSVGSIEGGPESEFPGLWAGRLQQVGQGKMSSEEAEFVFQYCWKHWNEVLPSSVLLALVLAAKDIISRQPSLLRLQTPRQGRVVVLGDTHGHLKDLVHVWKEEGRPSPGVVYLFNGDICDRGDSPKRGGQQALHIWASVLSFKLAFPDCIFVTRGNHEDKDYWALYGPSGFGGEIEAKYTLKEASQLVDAFGDLCNVLPLAAVIDDRCLVLHGGLPRCWQGPSAARLHDIAELKRPIAIPETAATRTEQIVYDVTWADPQKENGFGKNLSRGGDSVCFGPDVVKRFLKGDGLSLLVRSHELPAQDQFRGRGFEWWFSVARSNGEQPEKLSASQQGWCLTLFTASDYCGVAANKGARVVFSGVGGGSSDFSIIEHCGWQAELSLLQPSASLPVTKPSDGSAELEQQLLSTGSLLRNVVQAIVQHKHELFAEFINVDKAKDWCLCVESWVTCCSRVLPLLPWKKLAKEPCIVPLCKGSVNYMFFLSRYQVCFRHKRGLHAGFYRSMASLFFGDLLRADRPLRETLLQLDPNEDGTVSVEEFANALAHMGRCLLPSQTKALYRTAADQAGQVQVEEFLGALSLQFSLINPRLTTEKNAFVPQMLDAICRDILAVSEPNSTSIAKSLREFFEQADKNSNGYLELQELVDAVRILPCCATLSHDETRAIARYMDVTGDQRVNYAELLGALVVSHAEDPPQTEPSSTQRRRKGPKALLEDMLESVHRVLHFEYAKPLRALLRKMSPPGCTRCTVQTFKHALVTLNGSGGAPLLSVQQIHCLVESLDVGIEGTEKENSFDFEDYFDSFSIVDTMLSDVGEGFDSNVLTV